MSRAAGLPTGHFTVIEVASPPSDKLRANEAERQRRQSANATNGFFRLPAELRLRIYELTMQSPRWYHDFEFLPKWVKEDCPLLDVSRQIRAETMPMLLDAIEEIYIIPTDLERVLRCIAVLDDRTIAAIRRFRLYENDSRLTWCPGFYCAVDLRGSEPVMSCSGISSSSSVDMPSHAAEVDELIIRQFERLAGETLTATKLETGECVLTREVLVELVTLYSYKLCVKQYVNEPVEVWRTRPR